MAGADMGKKFYFIDRNVISRLKEPMKIREKEAAVLAEMDKPGNRVSPILACFEGQLGRLQNVDELKRSILKDSEFLSTVIKHARTDDMLHVAEMVEHLHAIVDHQAERWHQLSEYVSYAQVRLHQNIADEKLLKVAREIVAKARELDMPAQSIEVLAALSTLYKFKAARDTLKPHIKNGKDPKHIHNALQDLASLKLYSTLQMMIASWSNIECEFVTFDDGLWEFKDLINIRGSGYSAGGELNIRHNVEIPKELFPTITEKGYLELCEILDASIPFTWRPDLYKKITRITMQIKFVR